MSTLNERHTLAEQVAQAMGKSVYNNVEAHKDITPRLELQQKSPKLMSLEEAIRHSGLKDGMTISFHHHFRGGDKVVNMLWLSSPRWDSRICTSQLRACRTYTNRSSSTFATA